MIRLAINDRIPWIIALSPMNYNADADAIALDMLARGIRLPASGCCNLAAGRFRRLPDLTVDEISLAIQQCKRMQRQHGHQALSDDDNLLTFEDAIAGLTEYQQLRREA